MAVTSTAMTRRTYPLCLNSTSTLLFHRHRRCERQRRGVLRRELALVELAEGDAGGDQHDIGQGCGIEHVAQGQVPREQVAEDHRSDHRGDAAEARGPADAVRADAGRIEEADRAVERGM